MALLLRAAAVATAMRTDAAEVDSHWSPRVFDRWARDESHYGITQDLLVDQCSASWHQLTRWLRLVERLSSGRSSNPRQPA